MPNTYEQAALDEINELNSQIEYLKKTNRCLAKKNVNDDLVWIERHELKILSDIEQEGGLKQIKIDSFKKILNVWSSKPEIDIYGYLTSTLAKMEQDNA